MEYIKRFKNIALDYYDHYEERTLVEMCMTNMIREYRVVLENLEISQFAQLLQKARKTAQSVKPSSNKRSAPQAMAVSTGERRRKTDGSEYDTPPPIPCTPKELDVLLDERITNGVFKPNQVSKEPTKEEWRDPCFYHLHNYELSDKLILYLYYCFTCGENLMSFLCLCFVVHIDLLDVNGDVGDLGVACLLSQGFYFSFILSYKCVIVSLKSYIDSIYSHRVNIIY